ncbi:MAG TPA: cysteate synthase [Bacteroidales bacterium]|jgi:cysteate synthase|nr:cysteate synthase [Bacteroidales bacterium]
MIRRTEYVLRNKATGRLFEDTGWLLEDPLYGSDALIQAVYKNKQPDFSNHKNGLYRFADWLPIHRMLEGSAAPITYKSQQLADHLGLDHLYITFSGYWPERGAFMNTCSFKETEAFSICAHIPAHEKRTLVVASAGNTARAFAKVCSENNIPLLLFVPYDNLDALWIDRKPADCVRLISTPKGSDYFDAIALSNTYCEDTSQYFAEGGARNIARRDGMGTTVLSAADCIGRIPDVYFQAVGSGTGAIAAHEANERLLEDGRYGNHTMQLIPSQNVPFIPLVEAWEQGTRHLEPMEAAEAREKTAAVKAKVLANRKPPYAVAGGLYDALVQSGGFMDYATNRELERAGALFEQLEGIDIHPAAAVATHTLIKNVEQGRVDSKAVIMLNITGGGEKRFKSENPVYYITPD